MIEEIAGMPDGVDGFRLVGEITKADYDAVLTPWVNEIADSERDVRAVIVIGDDFTGYETGAAWEDTKLGLRMETHHRTLWKRVALVTETGWIKRLAALFGWMVPGEMRIFDLGHVDDAKEWAAQD
ncbi:MAG: STAS/SEC14 domain-containing protein [Solirubrobacterales bacterium]